MHDGTMSDDGWCERPQGLVNGSRGVVIGFEKSVVVEKRIRRKVRVSVILVAVGIVVVVSVVIA